MTDKKNTTVYLFEDLQYRVFLHDFMIPLSLSEISYLFLIYMVYKIFDFHPIVMLSILLLMVIGGILFLEAVARTLFSNLAKKHIVMIPKSTYYRMVAGQKEECES